MQWPNKNRLSVFFSSAKQKEEKFSLDYLYAFTIFMIENIRLRIFAYT